MIRIIRDGEGARYDPAVSEVVDFHQESVGYGYTEASASKLTAKPISMTVIHVESVGSIR